MKLTKSQRDAQKRLRGMVLWAAFAEFCEGPGWSNSPVWVVVRDPHESKCRIECLQPEEQTDAMRQLFAVSAAMHGAMTAAVRALMEAR